MAELATRAVAAWRTLPGLLQVAVIYIAARIFTLVVLVSATNASGYGSRFGAAATLRDFVLGWDANWYWIVADVGYPTQLPRSETGEPIENAWAFMPLYAWIAKFVSIPLGEWAIGAAIVSFVAGFGACAMLFLLLRERLTGAQALWAVAFFACGPVAALFHVGYAESLFMFFLLAALYALVQRHFWWVHALIIMMGFTRPGVLAFSLMLAFYGLWRWHHRASDSLPVREIVHIVVAGLLGAAVGLCWPLIAGVVMGEPNAYLLTELSWRRAWLPDSATSFVPFDGWIIGLNFWFGQWGLNAIIGWTVFGLALATAIWVLARSRYVAALGVEVRFFSASYLLYMLAVFFPQSSTLRLFLPLAPLWGAPAQLRPLWGRVAVLGACLIYQVIWIFEMYASGTTLTQIP